MKVLMMALGDYQTNCYLIYDEDTKDALVVDPGFSGKEITRIINEHGLKVKYIINTHCHGDHIGANAFVKQSTGAPLLIHKAEAPMLSDARQNLTGYMETLTEMTADGYLEEGQVLEVGKMRFQVLHTPGHSLGGVCLVGEGVCISGDTLFQGSIGRTDFPGGSFKQLEASIQNKLYCLDDDVVVLSGHGPATTIGDEKRTNPFVRAK
jgi:glyoxylase-like metal-dependent hydrolase (beta-lactamase superfamily II)